MGRKEQMTYRYPTDSIETPPAYGASVTPSDSTDLTTPARGLNVAVSGNVKVTLVGGDTVTYYIAAGIQFPALVSRVWSTGTDATGIVASW